MRRFAFLLFCLAFSASSSQAGEKPLGMVTGPKTGTYIAVGRDIDKVAAARGVEVDVKESGGSIENIKRLTSGENAALGIVQSDVLNFLARSKNPDSMRIASALRLIFPLYKEEVHLLARGEIGTFEELEGRKVVIGEEGSGSMLTAINLFSVMGVNPASMMKISAPEGVVAVLRGEADAVLFVGGKPVRVFKNLEELQKTDPQYAEMLEKVHFLPLARPRMLEEYPPAQITAQDYAFVKKSVPTLAVTSALVSYDFSSRGNGYNEARCTQVLNVAKAMRENLDVLRSEGHPKWREVDLDARLEGWKRDACAWPDAPDAKQAESLDHDLLSIVGQGGKRDGKKIEKTE